MGLGAVMLASAAAIAVVMLVTWVVSVGRHDASIVDPVWPLGFVVVAWVTRLVADGNPARQWLVGAVVTVWGLRLGGTPARQWLLVAMVTVWGLRLGGYLAWRRRGHGAEDFRYQAMRRKWGPWF